MNTSSKLTIYSSILSLALLASCTTENGDVGQYMPAEDARSISDARDQPTEDANSSAIIKVRSITLASGLVVDVRGPEDALDGLPETVTGAQLCEQFSLSLTATFDENRMPLKIGATAAWHALIGETSEPPFPPPSASLTDYLQPLFPNYTIPIEPLLGGVSSNPIAVFPLKLTESAGPLPQVFAIFHHDTGVPMAVFNHSPEGPYLAFPSTWQDATNGVTPNTEVSSRYIEGAKSLAQCDGYAEVITKTMKLSGIQDLATCGDIMAWAYSRPSREIGSENGTECVTPSQGFGVTLSPVIMNSWGTLECPRPPEAQFEYVCFSSSS